MPCTFYYATCVDGNRWTPTGWMMAEPLRVWGADPVGEEPDWCCEQLKAAVAANAGIETVDHFEEAPPDLRLNLPDNRYGQQQYESQPVRFCPFCGAMIVFTKHLDVKAVETPVKSEPQMENHYEEAVREEQLNGRT